MFSPGQVQEWNKLVLTEPTLDRKYCGHFLASVEMSFATEAPPLPARTTTIGMLHPPKHLFGAPFDSSCLDGIGTWPIQAADTQIQKFNNARIVGNSAVLTDGQKVYTPHDRSMATRQQFIDENAYGHQGFLVDDRGDALTIRFAQRQIPRSYPMNAVFVHNIEPANYGSFLFRQLPQLVLLRDLDVPFDCYVVSEKTAFLTEAIELLQLPKKPIFSAEEVVGDRFDSIVFLQVDEAEGFMNPTFRSQLMNLVQQVVEERVSDSPQVRLYVSRSLSTLRRPWYRVMKNETQVEQIVRDRGFKIVIPEMWSLVDQIRMFCNATHVIGPSGSGMFNVIFSQALRRVVDIETYHVTVRQHAKLYASCGSEYSFLFSPYCSDDTQHPAHRSSICPPDRLSEALDWLLAS